MILKLAIPAHDQSLRSGRVLRWYKREGDHVGFGDDICDIAIDEFAVLRRTGRATLLARARRGRLRDDLEVRQGKVYVEMRLTSSDQGVLRKIVAQEGDEIGPGAMIGLVVTGDETLDGPADRWTDATPMRVVVNTINDEDF